MSHPDASQILRPNVPLFAPGLADGQVIALAALTSMLFAQSPRRHCPTFGAILRLARSTTPQRPTPLLVLRLGLN